MKGFHMKTFFIALVAVVGLTIVDVGTAQAFGGRRRARVTYAPAPTATVAQGQAGTGYRTYSYQPSMSAPTYQSYRSPARTAPHLNSGRHSAGYKLTDF